MKLEIEKILKNTAKTKSFFVSEADFVIHFSKELNKHYQNATLFYEYPLEIDRRMRVDLMVAIQSPANETNNSDPYDEDSRYVETSGDNYKSEFVEELEDGIIKELPIVYDEKYVKGWSPLGDHIQVGYTLKTDKDYPNYEPQTLMSGPQYEIHWFEFKYIKSGLDNYCDKLTELDMKNPVKFTSKDALLSIIGDIPKIEKIVSHQNQNSKFQNHHGHVIWLANENDFINIKSSDSSLNDLRIVQGKELKDAYNKVYLNSKFKLDKMNKEHEVHWDFFSSLDVDGEKIDPKLDNLKKLVFKTCYFPV
ncbi:MAG: hypothetical protein CME65_12725 [Halobacteriovoraceae bacterium]|nr:hypothetical protein [Halobacteriovoraceae bacterium]|tara:strand:+ start:4004 stop:4924 length:921 start_codon:yes stop_codon:yes gene_type:complete